MPSGLSQSKMDVNSSFLFLLWLMGIKYLWSCMINHLTFYLFWNTVLISCLLSIPWCSFWHHGISLKHSGMKWSYFFRYYFIDLFLTVQIFQKRCGSTIFQTLSGKFGNLKMENGLQFYLRKSMNSFYIFFSFTTLYWHGIDYMPWQASWISTVVSLVSCNSCKLKLPLFVLVLKSEWIFFYFEFNDLFSRLKTFE